MAGSPSSTTSSEDNILNIRTKGSTTARHEAFATINGITYTLQDLTTTNTIPHINDVGHLALRINTGNDSRSVCETQDLLFALLAPLNSDHNLRHLEIQIQISAASDHGWAMFSINYAARMYPLDMARVLRSVKPGDLSRAHIAAFLTDPFRNIGNVRDGRKQGKFSPSFIGDSGKPWQEIPWRLRDAVRRTNAEIKDYKVFCDYFRALRPLIKATIELSKLLNDKESG